jgi:hypothetical protein
MRIAQRSFKRTSPASFAEKVGLPMGWIVVRHDHVAEKLKRRKTHGRWVSIKSTKGKVYRVLRYSVNLPADQIVMDWVGWIDLQGRTDQETEEVQLTISTARLWEHIVIPFKHIDPGYRMSAWLGAISVALGALSVILSVVLSGS